jgi:low affinity Fe/Cu permease
MFRKPVVALSMARPLRRITGMAMTARCAVRPSLSSAFAVLISLCTALSCMIGVVLVQEVADQKRMYLYSVSYIA